MLHAGLAHIIENSKSDAVRLKACVATLELIGINDPQKLWIGIGTTDPDRILLERESERKSKQFLSDLITRRGDMFMRVEH
jgi:hypothetical protein